MYRSSTRGLRTRPFYCHLHRAFGIRTRGMWKQR